MINVGASISTRADFDAAAITPPPSPICAPTATADDRSFTARPLQIPAIADDSPSAWAIGRNANSATTLKTKTTPIATPCSSRLAPATGARPFTADAPQIIVPPASTSASGRRTPNAAASAWVTKNVLGSVVAITPPISASSRPPNRPVWTLRPMRMMPSRRIQLPVNRSPGAARSASRSGPPGGASFTSRRSGVFTTNAPRSSAITTSETSGDFGKTRASVIESTPSASASPMPGASTAPGTHCGRRHPVVTGRQSTIAGRLARALPGEGLEAP